MKSTSTSASRTDSARPAAGRRPTARRARARSSPTAAAGRPAAARRPPPTRSRARERAGGRAGSIDVRRSGSLIAHPREGPARARPAGRCARRAARRRRRRSGSGRPRPGGTGRPRPRAGGRARRGSSAPKASAAAAGGGGVRAGEAVPSRGTHQGARPAGSGRGRRTTRLTPMLARWAAATSAVARSHAPRWPGRRRRRRARRPATARRARRPATAPCAAPRGDPGGAAPAQHGEQFVVARGTPAAPPLTRFPSIRHSARHPSAHVCARVDESYDSAIGRRILTVRPPPPYSLPSPVPVKKPIS